MEAPSPTTEQAAELQTVLSKVKGLKEEISKVIIGQDEVVEQMLICFFAAGHALLTGVPGLGKTLLIKTISQCINMDFNRVQFVPDLMPSDIVGSELIQVNEESGMKDFIFRPGPVFANIFMADEINRASPKTQSALLEVMQEKMVTVGGKNRTAGDPFCVFATQNPLEFEGTYPLPEAQLDRFLFNIEIVYPESEEEYAIADTKGFATLDQCTSVMNKSEVKLLQQTVDDIPIAADLLKWCVDLVRSTRQGTPSASPLANDYIKWGAGPRAAQALLRAARSAALLDGRFNVSRQDVEKCLLPVMRHRIALNYKADAEDITVDSLLTQLVDQCKPTA